MLLGDMHMKTSKVFQLVLAVVITPLLVMLPGQGFAQGSRTSGGAVSSDGSTIPHTYAYIPNGGGYLVNVIDTYDLTDVINIDGLVLPGSVGCSPTRQECYVASQGDIGDNNQIYVISTVTNTITNTIPTYPETIGLAVSPDGKYILACQFNEGELTIIDVENNYSANTVQFWDGRQCAGVDFFPRNIAPGTSEAFISDWDGSNLVRYLVPSLIVLDVIPIAGAQPTAVAVTPNGRLALVTNGGNNSLDVVSTASNQQINVVPVVPTPYAVAVSPDSTTAYVSTDTAVSVVDLTTFQVTATISFDGYPTGLQVTPDGRSLIVVGGESQGGVWKVQTSDNQILGFLPLGGNARPYGKFLTNLHK